MNHVITPLEEQKSNEINNNHSKFLSLRNKIAVKNLTKKGLVELSKEGK